MLHNFDALHNLLGMFAHQQVIGCDVWFTLHTVDHQKFDGFMFGTVGFDISWEAGATHACDASMVDNVDQCLLVELGIVGNRVQLAPLIFTVGRQDNTQLR